MVTSEGKKWAYFNVLEALLSLLPPGDYPADVGIWADAIAALREKYEDEVPELFSDIHFVLRPKSRAYSPQVSDFFVSQSFGGIKKVLNPTFEIMRLEGDAIEELTKRNRDVLEKYCAVIHKMAADLKAMVEESSASKTESA